MTTSIILREENIAQQIYFIRGEKIMLDFDLAQLYQVETRALKQAVKRNLESFPSDFMFVLTGKEIKYMVSQNVIPSKGKFGGALPYAFTEHEYFGKLDHLFREGQYLLVSGMICTAPWH